MSMTTIDEDWVVLSQQKANKKDKFRQNIKKAFSSSTEQVVAILNSLRSEDQTDDSNNSSSSSSPRSTSDPPSPQRRRSSSGQEEKKEDLFHILSLMKVHKKDKKEKKERKKREKERREKSKSLPPKNNPEQPDKEELSLADLDMEIKSRHRLSKSHELLPDRPPSSNQNSLSISAPNHPASPPRNNLSKSSDAVDELDQEDYEHMANGALNYFSRDVYPVNLRTPPKKTNGTSNDHSSVSPSHDVNNSKNVQLDISNDSQDDTNQNDTKFKFTDADIERELDMLEMEEQRERELSGLPLQSSSEPQPTPQRKVTSPPKQYKDLVTTSKHNNNNATSPVHTTDANGQTVVRLKPSKAKISVRAQEAERLKEELKKTSDKDMQQRILKRIAKLEMSEQNLKQREESRAKRNEQKMMMKKQINEERKKRIDKKTVPKTWLVQADPYQEFTITSDSPEYKLVETVLNANIGAHGRKYGTIHGEDPVAFKVKKVVRIQNEELWRTYQFEKSRLESKYDYKMSDRPCTKYLAEFPIATPSLDPAVNEYYLFHGTRWEVIDIVKKQGFDERVSAVTGMFGAGIYFAENASKSNQYIPCPTCNQGAITTEGQCSCSEPGVFGMLLCRVILGDTHICLKYDENKYKGDPRNPVRRPPAKTEGGLDLYDSILGESKKNGADLLKYREFIVYDRRQVYPEYIVYYKRVPPPVTSEVVNLK